MLGAAGVQIPENNLDDLHSSREEDGTSETMDPQDLLGSFLLADTDLRTLDLLTGTLVLDFLVPEGCDPLALVDGFTPVKDNIGLLRTRFDEEVVFVFVFPEDVTSSVNLNLLSLFFGFKATNLSHELLMLGQIESHKSSTEHPIVNEFIIINIPEEDVEPEPNLPLQEIIILDPDDQPMWENAKIVAPTPNSPIVQPNVDDNFVINNTHLNMIWESKFDGYLRADPHDHIREFLAICDMFKYGETQSEAVKLLIFPFSLCDEAKTWFNELNEESITSWK
ncbi:hypothetical protein Tco_0431525 [Tanacetum coccineum]